MADTKITALTALTAADPANDVIPIVDVSDTTMAASGTTKKISVNNILGASGTATLASATITGALTVDTNVLKVDTTNDRVGIGTASPGKRCEINQSANAITTIGSGEILRLIGDDGNTNSRITEVGFGTGPTGATFAPVIVGAVNTNISGFGTKDFYVATRTGTSDVAPLERYRIDSTGVATWSVAGSTAMTLNSTGLAIGGAALAKFTAYSTTNGDTLAVFRCTGTGTQRALYISADNSTGVVSLDASGAAAGSLQFKSGATNTMLIDTSGNVGVGVSTFGTSAAKVLAIATGTEPTTGPAGTVQLFTSTRSASNTIPAIFTEGSGVTNAAITNTTVTNKIAIKVNGTIYYLLATTSAA